MKLRTSVVFAVAVVGAACGKKTAEPSAAGSAAPDRGSGAATATSTSPAPPKPPAPPAPPKIDDAALDAAITAKGFNPRSVRQRSIGPHSAWAVIQAPRDAAHNVVELDVLRVRPDGADVLKLTPTVRSNPTRWDNDIEPMDIRDLDGDGNDDCVVVLRWLQDLPGTGLGEAAKQLYVIVDAAPPRVAYTTIVDYTTASDDTDAGGGKTKPAPPEHVGYDWKIDGTPPVLSLKRTANQLNAKRAAGLTVPATEPLMSAGAGKDIPLPLK